MIIYAQTFSFVVESFVSLPLPTGAKILGIRKCGLRSAQLEALGQTTPILMVARRIAIVRPGVETPLGIASMPYIGSIDLGGDVFHFFDCGERSIETGNHLT